jgi:hypothetical protein
VKNVVFATLVFFISCVQIANQAALAGGSDPPNKRKVKWYQVWGYSTQEPKKYRPWAPIHQDDRAAAVDDLAELKRNYGKGGLLESSLDHPVAPKIEEFDGWEYLPPAQKMPQAPADPLTGPRSTPPNSTPVKKYSVKVYRYDPKKKTVRETNESYSGNDLSTARQIYFNFKDEKGVAVKWLGPDEPKQATPYNPPKLDGPTSRSGTRPPAPTKTCKYWFRRDGVEVSFNTFEEAKSSIIKYAKQQDAMFPGGTSSFAVYSEDPRMTRDPNGAVYRIRCRRGVITEGGD